jgi:YtkA-like
MRWVAVFCVGCVVELEPTTPDDGPDCAGAQVFTVGMQATTPSGVTVRIAAASPAPPDVGDNTWTLELEDASGAPLTGASPVVTPWMPLHGHGLAPSEYFCVEDEAGAYVVDTFDLVMPGLWQFTVEVADGDAVQFDLCAEG